MIAKGRRSYQFQLKQSVGLIDMISDGDANVWREVYLQTKALHTEGAKDIRIGFISRWRLEVVSIPQPVTPRNSQQASQNAEEQTSTSGRKRRRDTTTERQLHRAEIQSSADRAIGNHVPDIVGKWMCRVRGCPNVGHPCYIVQFKHYRLDRGNLTTWSTLVDEKKAKVEAAPQSVLINLVDKGHCYPVNREKKIKAESLSTQLPQLPANTPLIVNFGGPFPASFGQEATSSPPKMEGNDLHNVEEYCNWLESKGYLSLRVLAWFVDRLQMLAMASKCFER